MEFQGCRLQSQPDLVESSWPTLAKPYHKSEAHLQEKTNSTASRSQPVLWMSHYPQILRGLGVEGHMHLLGLLDALHQYQGIGHQTSDRGSCFQT